MDPNQHLTSPNSAGLNLAPHRAGSIPPQMNNGGNGSGMTLSAHRAASIAPNVPLGAPMGGPMAGDEQGMVQKCARFFRTLIQLSQTPETDPNRHETHARVKELVSNVIFGRMEAEEFTARLQDALRSQAQPHLLPFLQRTLPYLRNALSSGEVVIEGINPPNQNIHPPLPGGSSPRAHVSLNTCHGSHSSLSSSTSLPPPVVSSSSAPADDEMATRVLMETPIKSAIIRPVEIMRKITRRITNVCYVDEDVLTLISDAAEYRLRKVMSELSALTEHRLYMLKSHPNYETVDDTRKQIRFVEEVDREYEERREAREKEQLIRMSKNKKTGKETMERAKEMQKADAEVMRNRDANAAAIAALSGGRTKRKWEATSHSQSTINRPRTLRVNMRDMQSVLSRDARSKVALRLAYAVALSDGHA